MAPMIVGSAVVLASLAGVAGVWTQPESPLSGPKVQTRKGAFSLAGEFRRETLRPEERAVKALDLAPEARAAVEKLFVQRGRVIKRFILDHIDLLNRLNVAGAAGNQFETAGLIFVALGKFEATGIRGDFTGLVREALPEHARPAFDREMNEYWAMVAMEKTGKLRSQLTQGEVYGARLEETLKIFGKEFEEAFQRAERSGEFVVAYLLDGLKLSPRQRETINGIVFSKMESLAEDAPESEKIKVLLGIMAYLTEEQQGALMKKIKGE